MAHFVNIQHDVEDIIPGFGNARINKALPASRNSQPSGKKLLFSPVGNSVTVALVM